MQLNHDGTAVDRATNQGTKIARQAISKHLHPLAEAGLVRSTRDRRERIWQLQTKRLHDVRNYLEQISTQRDDAIERLRALVEHDER